MRRTGPSRASGSGGGARMRAAVCARPTLLLLLLLLLPLAIGGGCVDRGRDDLRQRDRETIRETLGRYAIFLDDGRVEDFLDLFTEDAVFSAAEFVYDGRDAIRRELAEKPRGPGKHLPFPALVEFDSETEAHAWSDYLRIKQGEAGNPESWVITSVGRYYDRLVRGDDGRWRFRRRDVQILEMANRQTLTEPKP